MVMSAKIAHFEGAEGFALLVVPPFCGYAAATIAGDAVATMHRFGVVLIQIAAWFTAASLMALVIVGISAFALSIPVPIDDEEQ